MEINLFAVDPRLASKVWPLASPFIEKSYTRADYKMPLSLLEDLTENRKLLWVVVDMENDQIIGALTTAIYIMNTGKMCKIEHCGGTTFGADWWYLRSVIEEYAKREGCVRVMFEGRRELAKVLPDYRPIAVILEKRI